MNTVTVQPMQWKPVPDISKAQAFTDADADLFEELREVLAKFGALDRFGISLIHDHFEIANDEFLMEFTDIENRTLTIKPVRLSELGELTYTITNWKMTMGDEIATTACGCAKNYNEHFGYHRKT
jgi:hypothetical protein